MLVDRIIKSRFDSLEFERENGYRHPHCIIVRIIHSGARREEQAENYVEEHPCTDIELIEENFDSNPWLCVYSLCVDVMLMNVCFLLCIFFDMLCI
jgi:hypothetical protein